MIRYCLILSVLIPASPASAEVGIAALVDHLTGIPAVNVGDTYHPWENPASLAATGGFLAVDANAVEGYRRLTGPDKRLAHNGLTVAAHRVNASGRAGLYMAYRGRAGEYTWPFSDGRVRAKVPHDAGGAMFAGWFSDERGRLTVGAAVGKPESGPDMWYRAVHLIARLPRGILLDARYRREPFRWDMPVAYDSIGKSIAASLSYETTEAHLTVPLGSGRWHVDGSVMQGRISPIDSPGGPAGTHRQLWEGDRYGWRAGCGGRIMSHLDAAVGFERDISDGELGVWAEDSQYLRAFPELKTVRFTVDLKPRDIHRAMPDLAYVRTTTEAVLARGIADSWAFTPSQIAVLGDKTWSVSGTGALAADTVTMSWRCLLRPALSLVRLHPDYSLRITTRDHLSLNPFNMLFGTTRTETDRTRYADLAVIAISHHQRVGPATLTLALRQIIPLRHTVDTVVDDTPTPISISDLPDGRPENFGGFSMHVRLKFDLPHTR
jgi:hypothetical protein